MHLIIRRNLVIIICEDTGDVLPFGEGESALQEAMDFINRVRMAELAAELAGWAH